MTRLKKEKYEQISQEKANEIIETREPLGKFWCKEGNIYVAIDNSTGDAWTEDFDNYEECEKYLDEEN